MNDQPDHQDPIDDKSARYNEEEKDENALNICKSFIIIITLVPRLPSIKQNKHIDHYLEENDYSHININKNSKTNYDLKSDLTFKWE